jgi:hypothetical protein
MVIKLKEILSEANNDPKSIFGDIAFGTEKQFVKLQGKTGTENNTQLEQKIFDALLGFINRPDSVRADFLYKNMDLFKKSKTKFPSIFKPDTSNGTEVYRGLSLINRELLSKLEKSTTTDDYTKVKIGGITYYQCNKPIIYTPHSSVQTWTYSKSIAAQNNGEFAVLITNQNDEYLFSQKAMKIFLNTSEQSSGLDQKSVLHFGKKYSKPVYIALSEEYFSKINLNYNNKSNKVGNEKDAKSVFQNVAFGQESEYNTNAKSIAKLQGKLAGERDTKTEAEIVEILADWFLTGMAPSTAKKLYKHLELFKDAKEKYPKIFKPSTKDGTILYRGLTDMSSNFKEFFKKGTLKTDWKKQTIGTRTYMVLNKSVQYKPENLIQSWTHSKEVALDFADSCLIMTRQDEDFIFNQKFMAILADMNEKEVLHFGRKFSNPVTIAVELGMYNKYVKPYAK